MTIVVYDINTNVRSSYLQNGDIQHTTLSLKDYLEIAQRCIGSFAPSNIACRMLHDEDAISYVAEHLMYAACTWNPSGGKTLRSYLNQGAIWAVRSWSIKYGKAFKKQLKSLNAASGYNDETMWFNNVVDKKTRTPMEIACETETIDMIKRCGLNERQLYCIERVYIDGLSMADVARTLGVSRQAVEQQVKRGLAMMHNVMVNDG